MKIITVVGARPQFIKAAALSKEFYKNNLNNYHKIEELIIHTGQHFDSKMSACFFEDLEIPKPVVNLGIGGKSHGAATGRMIEAIEKLLIRYKPDYVLVYGDTNSTLAAALAASKLNISILHIEAGLRSFDRTQPEEKNRVITDYLSEVCFAPTDIAVKNLINENINPNRIFRCGDIMADVLRIYFEKIQNESRVKEKFNIQKFEYCLLTIHREENTNNKKILENILDAVSSLPHRIVLPLHPRTKSKIIEFDLGKYLEKFILSEPLNYFEMMKLTQDAELIITDSGGLQKESYLNKVPCVTLRDNTEWIELVDSKWNLLINPNNKKNIKEGINKQINFDKKSPHPSFYGEGYAAKEILNQIIKSFGF